ncbi:hypothetical protein OCS_04494 [Ophiocordyceps sinensis CO18]|uniref:Clr5 domain-containing protein n=1 Tax=Ophiocordyceps sinensis (strain Co18 / CGMCC 3.14243) TaxID=911162 RepID=T5AD88_OPHSC|nr:hypothetical protein OCS_04494 [Ophiocordyceps sinensis CO18]
MTKPFDSYRGEIVRLYIDENKTLEVVMDLMRARHCFTASRRSYMDNLKKWGVRKYKRKVVVHNQNGRGADGDADADDSQSPGQGGGDEFASLSTAAAPDETAPRPGAQSLTHGFPHDVELQHDHAPALHDHHGWGYFAHSSWPAEASLAPYAAAQYAAGSAPQ